MEIKLQATESFSTYIVRDLLTINTEDYPQLEGMSEEEVKEYIKWNSEDIYEKGVKTYSLWDKMLNQDIIKENITDDETEVLVD